MLELISFVGVDTKTDFDKISKLNDNSKIPLEFGVLYSEKRGGLELRYPTYGQCKHLLGLLEVYDVLSSLHLCGSEAIDKFLDGDDDLVYLAKKACRVQLNFNIKKYDLEELTEKLIKVSENHTLIIQDNQSKKEFVELLKSKANDLDFSNCSDRFNFLFDASGGVGKVITDFTAHDPKYFTGYAGGINPENVGDIVTSINDVNSIQFFDNSNSMGYYIDMESGIRTNDHFDIKKCADVVKTCEQILRDDGAL